MPCGNFAQSGKKPAAKANQSACYVSSHNRRSRGTHEATPRDCSVLAFAGSPHDLTGNHIVGAGVGSVAVALVCGQAVSGSEQRVDNGFLVAQLDVIAVPVSPAGLAFFAAALAIAALAALRLSR